MLSKRYQNELEQFMEQGNACVPYNKQQAILYFNSAVLLAPENIEALISCAETLIHLNRPAEASIYSQRALQLHLTPNILILHAKALYQMGEVTKALDCIESVIAKQPDNYKAHNQRALCLTQVNRHDEALAAYQQALKYSNQDACVYYHYSLCLLAMGKLLQGFEFFEKCRTWILPESIMLHGKSILVHAEQDLSDSIQFFRYIPLLVQCGAQVFLEMQPALIPLLFPWRHSIRFIAVGSQLPSCDYHCPLMYLASLFKTELDTIPVSIPYLFPNINSFDACQKKLGLTLHQRIGIAWKNNSVDALKQHHAIDLNHLLTLHRRNMDFLCLQKDISPEEKTALQQHRIPYHGLELSTLEGTVALIACLDLIITVDNAIAHLAAAMGKEVWILLPFSADWRWFLQRDDSPWYPNVKLFRQAIPGDWGIPVSRIKDFLQPD